MRSSRDRAHAAWATIRNFRPVYRMWCLPANVSQSRPYKIRAKTANRLSALQPVLRLYRNMPKECYQRGEVMIHPIEAKSYQILSEQFDFSTYDEFQQAVVKRVIHATADFELAGSLAFSTGAAQRGIAAIKAQSPVICDVEMVRAGITSYGTECFLKQTKPSATGIPTRSYMAMAKAAQQYPTNAIFVVGCAPTALYALIELADQEWFKPALVIGLPVGFVGASESKEALRKSTLPHITNTGNKGGSPAASAAFNSLVRIAKENRDHDGS